MLYDCMIIGGGIAGLQAAIQLGRYQYKILVIDAQDGRSNLCHCYHNLLGWPNGVSGETLRMLGGEQAKGLGVHFIHERVEHLENTNGMFLAHTKNNASTHQSKRLLLATGIKDNIPPFPEILPCLGISLFVCPDCDGYEIINEPTIVIGSGKAGAQMALALTHWSQKITFINHGLGKIEESMAEELKKNKISVFNKKIKTIHTDDSQLQGLTLENGERITSQYGFLALGGNKVNTALAAQLGVELQKNRHIQVDPRTKMTNIKHVWAAGDIAFHSEQVAIAMGDGLQAAIWIHKSLQKES